jgi:hypothetical protein
VTKTITRKYIFQCKLSDKPVCVVWDLENGFRSDLLEELGIWHKIKDASDSVAWKINYPMIVKYGTSRHEMTTGDTFNLSLR